MDIDELREGLLELLDAGVPRHDWRKLVAFPHVDACVDRGDVYLHCATTGIYYKVRRGEYHRPPLAYEESVREHAAEMEKAALGRLDDEAEAHNIIDALGVDTSEDFFGEFGKRPVKGA